MSWSNQALHDKYNHFSWYKLYPCRTPITHMINYSTASTRTPRTVENYLLPGLNPGHRDYLLHLEIGINYHPSREPTIAGFPEFSAGEVPILYLDQPITPAITQANRRRCLIPHWQSYKQQAKTVEQSSHMTKDSCWITNDVRSHWECYCVTAWDYGQAGMGNYGIVGDNKSIG